MDIVIETVSITVSLVILFMIPAALLAIAYHIKRNGLYVSVNCWFCNRWTKVLYSSRNSFYCPDCLQYNGFNKDGGYNKVIEEQFHTSFNKYQKTVEKTAYSSNGLCTYCNNNQQLKVRQLASFVPLHENNYDVEVEHFRAQLEKSYKLCKKCEKVLKITINKQHAWLFGNRIKDLKKKGLSLLNSHKSKRLNVSVKTILTSCLRYFLVLLSLVILCQAIGVKLNYQKNIVKKCTPDIFLHYTLYLNDWYHLISNTIENVITNACNKMNVRLISGLKNLMITRSDIWPMTWIGLILQIFLFIWQQKSILWKANDLLSWVVLILTSLNIHPNEYSNYVKAVQIICSATTIYSLTATTKPRSNSYQNKKFVFKKLQKKVTDDDSSDEDMVEETSSHFNSSMSDGSTGNKFFADLSHRSKNWSQNIFNNTAKFRNTFTARSTKSLSPPNTSYKNESSCSSNELHRSFDNLHLSLNSVNATRRICSSPTLSVNSVRRPILSPPKLKNITQNSWTAGGFWKNDLSPFPPSANFAKTSRSSSQSSGFVSNNAYHSLPSSREPSPHGDFERRSLLSEPGYRFSPVNTINQLKHSFPMNDSRLLKPCLLRANQLHYKAGIILDQNMDCVQGNGVPRLNVEGSFGNLSLNADVNMINSPSSFRGKPVISSLFKNLPGVSAETHIFKAPSY